MACEPRAFKSKVHYYSRFSPALIHLAKESASRRELKKSLCSTFCQSIGQDFKTKETMLRNRNSTNVFHKTNE